MNDGVARKQIKWTPELEETLHDLWLDGLTGTQIADRMGMTRNMVLGKLKRKKDTMRGKS